MAEEMTRKYTADADGNWSPTPASLPYNPITEAPPAPFAVGDTVSLTGRVAEVQHLQGEEWNVRVEHEDGDLWVHARHVKAVRESPLDKMRRGPSETK